MVETKVLEQVFNRKWKPAKACLILKWGMKSDMLKIREDICSVYSWRNEKTQAYDLKKVPESVIKAVLQKKFELGGKNKLEEEYELYKQVLDLIKNKKINIDLFDSYMGKNKLLDEEKKNIKTADKFAAEQVQNALLDEEKEAATKTVVELAKEVQNEKEEEKFNKNNEIKKKEKKTSSKPVIQVSVVEEVISELGLEDELKIK